jgi:hypothetical protein
MCGFNNIVQQTTHLVVPWEFSEEKFQGTRITGGRRVRQISPRAIFLSLGLPQGQGIPTSSRNFGSS